MANIDPSGMKHQTRGHYNGEHYTATNNVHVYHTRGVRSERI
jgi:hypothetical protein